MRRSPIEAITFAYWLLWSIRDLAAFLLITDSGAAYRFTLLIGPIAALVAILMIIPGDGSHFMVPANARWVLLYTIWCGASLLWTQADKVIDAECMFFSMVGDLIFVALIMSVASERRRALRAMCWALVVGAVAIGGFVAVKIDPTSVSRVGDSNVGATYLGDRIGLGALSCLYLAVSSGRFQRRLLFLMLLFLVCVLGATGSKISVPALGASVLVFVFRSHALRPAIRAVIVLGCIGTGIIGLYFTSGYEESYRDNTDLQTLTGRTELWPAVVHLIAEKPILGYGLDSFENVEPSNVAWHAMHAHNEVLQQWVTLGIVGVCLSFLIYWEAFREAREKNSPVADLVVMVLTFCIVRGLTDPEVSGLVYPLPIALMFTCCSSARVVQVTSRLQMRSALL